MYSLAGRDPHTGRMLQVTVEEGFVKRIEESAHESELYLSAGFVDLQVNGCAGFDLNADSLTTETVLGLTEAMLAGGVTTYVPTLITAPEASLLAKLEILAHTRRSYARVAAAVPFVHMEGPHISPLDGYRGAHSAVSVRPPDIAEFDRWQQAAGGIVGMVTLSPHDKGITEYIEALVKRGIRVAIGHTHASPDEIRHAVDAGATLCTHLGNGIAQQLPRHSNPLWSQLADDRLTASFIADGLHLPNQVLKAMLRAKGLERSLLVSDLVALAGMPVGVYETPVGGRVELHADGRLCVYGSELLAGSTATLAVSLGRFMQMTRIPLSEAIALVTTHPGHVAEHCGRLEVGARADLVRFAWSSEIRIEAVWLAGEPVYAAG